MRLDAKVAGIYGGGQALHKVLALQNERTIKTYKVFSRNADNRKRFCARMAKLVEAEFVPVDTPREVMRCADVMICATNSNVLVLDGAWIEPGQHIVTVVGSMLRSYRVAGSKRVGARATMRRQGVRISSSQTGGSQ